MFTMTTTSANIMVLKWNNVAVMKHKSISLILKKNQPTVQESVE